MTLSCVPSEGYLLLSALKQGGAVLTRKTPVIAEHMRVFNAAGAIGSAKAVADPADFAAAQLA